MSALTIEVKTTQTMDGIYVLTKDEELYFVTASYDTDPVNPHEDYGTIELVTTKNRYFWGDITCDDPRTELDSRREIGQEFAALPLFLYAHSGISISVTPYHDQWDSGQVGYAICTKQNVIDQFGTEKLVTLPALLLFSACCCVGIRRIRLP